MKTTKIVFIAMSLDGYITDHNNSIDWLTNFPNPYQEEFGYEKMIKSVDTIIMGRKTYESLLAYDLPEWPYIDYTTYVVSSTFETSTPNTIKLNQINLQTLAAIQKHTKKGCWIVGGKEIITSLLSLGFVDELVISVIPILLGGGTKLFGELNQSIPLQLQHQEAFQCGIVNLTYTINKKKLESLSLLDIRR